MYFMSYIAPSFRGSAFNCPYCNAYANMRWSRLSFSLYSGDTALTPIYQANCAHCKKESFWMSHNTEHGLILFPLAKTAPLPHPDMPENIKIDYEEARSICANSPRGAAALLRLAIQKLCIHLGEKGKKLNDDIGSLVKEGLPGQIQKALDIVRVIGNNAIHPGVLNSEDVSEVATTLFELVNQIIEDRISRPKKLDELFKGLPPGALEGIEKRDKE